MNNSLSVVVAWLSEKKAIIYKTLFGFTAVFILLLPFIGYVKGQVPNSPAEFDFSPKKVPGMVFNQTYIQLIQNELNHGWLPNSTILYKYVPIIDNRPNFQLGVRRVLWLSGVEYLTSLARLRTTGQMDKGIEKALSLIANDPEAVLWPRYDWQLAKAIHHLENYGERLQRNPSLFSIRADNLENLMRTLASIMGDTQNRLATSSREAGTKMLSEEAAGDQARVSDDTEFTASITLATADDEFYTAKGEAYAIHAILSAVRTDFEPVLKTKKAVDLLDKAIEELTLAIGQNPTIVMKGEGGMANDLLNLSGPFGQALRRIKELADMLRNA